MDYEGTASSHQNFPSARDENVFLQVSSVFIECPAGGSNVPSNFEDHVFLYGVETAGVSFFHRKSINVLIEVAP